ncbi:hypothetical protein BJF78_25665 [Pseudonocardia sp. CNS-139]|nr:hypothetical protein BJF78_25665 [Pseudonocardia sp. CNS-139]
MRDRRPALTGPAQPGPGGAAGPAPSGSDAPRPGRRLVFAVVAAALLLGSVDQTSVATALTAIQAELAGTLAWSSWTITVYAVGQIIAMPVAGRLSDQFGPRTVLLAAIVVFTATALCAGLARDMAFLIAVRACRAWRPARSCRPPPASSPTGSAATATVPSGSSPASSRSARSSARWWAGRSSPTPRGG